MSGAIALRVAGDWLTADWRRGEYEESGEARRPQGYLDFKAVGRQSRSSSYFEMLAEYEYAGDEASGVLNSG